MKRFLLILLAVGLIAGGVWLSRSRKQAAQAPAATQTGPASADPTGVATARPDSRTARVFSRNFVRPASNTGTNAPWDPRVEEILNAEGADAEKSARLLALFPQLPADQQEDLALQLAPQVPDKDYAPLGSILTNTATAGEVAEVLLTDLLDRPDSIKLPLLLDIARLPDHTKAEDARDLLEVMLDVNYGSDWEAWSKKISAWLASHPENKAVE